MFVTHLKDVDISSGARKNDVNARIVFARNSSFCQAHAFEVLTIYHLYVLLSKFHTKQDFVSNMYPAILFTILMGF